jgi:U32 family peptidase
MVKKIKPELLAPAGDFLKLKTALAFGADAVYFGVPDFSLRTRINNFTWSDIKEAVKYIKKKKKKAYLTLNIFAHNQHLDQLKKHLQKIRDIAPDALIISDPGVLALAKKYLPKIKIILSTQANTTNYLALNYWEKQGISRFILSRELKYADIALIIKKKKKKSEVEVFVHGALCMAYSGRCFLSQYFKQANANLGDCLQPCRFKYQLKAINGQEEMILGEDKNGTYFLNSLDLCLIRKIPQLIDIGVSSFKIEGRAKSVYYLANVVGAYRQAIDLAFKQKDINKELNYLYNELESKLVQRGFTEGLMFVENTEKLQNNLNNKNKVKWEFCGQVVSSQQKEAVIKVHNSLKVGDQLEIISPSYNLTKLKVKNIYRSDNREEIKEAHGGGGSMEIILKLDKNIPQFSVLRRKIML